MTDRKRGASERVRFLPELIPKFHPVRFDPTLFKKAALAAVRV
ncbi:hypothetical protein [Leptospira weilii]|nr:hypothetical protein [Leptospira weilii]